MSIRPSPLMGGIWLLLVIGVQERWRVISTFVNFSVNLQPQGSPERITFYNGHSASPIWASDGKSILFSRTGQVGNHSIWRINLSGPKSEPVPVSADSSGSLDLARRGGRLVYTREISNVNVWGVDLSPPNGGPSRISNPRPWIRSSIESANPQFPRRPADRISVRGFWDSGNLGM